MNLTAEQFAEVLSNLGEGPVVSQGEKRRARRVPIACRVSIMIGNDPQHAVAQTVTVRDFSPRGLSILHNVKMQTGMQFVARLAAPDGASVSILCTVAHCRRERRSLFIIGAEFTCILDAASTAPAEREAVAGDMERIRRSVLD